MDPDRYCADQAAPPGSSLHYATLFAGDRERAALVAIHALRHALLAIVDSIADPDVRAHKLNWWSGEILEARDGRARHPIAVALTHRCGKWIWRRPEVLAMLAAITDVSAANGITSEAARGRFCNNVGGGTAELCSGAAALGPGEAGSSDLRILGAALEGAELAGAPIARSGLRRIPDPVPDTRNGDGRGRPHGSAQHIAEERARAREVLAGAARDMPRRAGPVVLVYRTLADIQLSALASALGQPARAAPAAASIAPIRKLWISWRNARRDR